MALQAQYMTFFVSPFSEPSSSAELKNFLKSHRIINVEKRLIDGERGTGWVFLVEFTDIEGGKSAYTMSSKVDWRDVNLQFMISCEKQERKLVIRLKFRYMEF